MAAAARRVLRAADVEAWPEAPLEELLEAASMPVRPPLTDAGHVLPRFGVESVETVRCEVAEPGDAGDAGDAGPAESGSDKEPGGEAAAAAAAAPAAAPSSSSGKQQQQQQRRTRSPAKAKHTFSVDTLLYAGGPVWAMAWAPLHGRDAAAGPVQTVELLALSTHPRGQRRNPIGAAHAGPGALQLWGVPRSHGAALLPGGVPSPLALLWHGGRLAWDLQWCPDPAAFVALSSNLVGRSSSAADADADGGAEPGAVPLCGLLAAVLGDGNVALWGVPTIAWLLEARAAAGSGAAAAEPMDTDSDDDAAVMQPLSLRLPPLMRLGSAAVGGSLASCCRWLPDAPHDQLLVGCWDGRVAIWKLPLSAGGEPEPVQLLRADAAPIRSVAWQPSSRWWLTGGLSTSQAAALLRGGGSAQPAAATSAAAAAAATSSSSSSNCRYIATASSLGTLKVWDSRDVLQPCHERVVNRHSLNDLVWLGPPHVLATAGADGVLRQVWLDAGVQAAGTTHLAADVSSACGCLWALAPLPRLGLLAYVGDGGLLGLAPLEPPSSGEPRHRKSHAALSGVAEDNGQLWLLSAREVPGNGGLYTAAAPSQASGKRKADAPATVVLDPLPHPYQVLHALAASPNGAGTAMVAYAGSGGLVRLHPVSAHVAPLGL